MREREWVRFIIRFDVLDVDRFRAMAAAMSAVSAGEPGTVVYDWYLDEGSGTAALYEAYATFEALDAHLHGAVFTEVGPQYAGASKVRSVEVFGEADRLPRGDLLGAPATWWGAPIATATG
jgi:quinol monooxygenase YgiN